MHLCTCYLGYQRAQALIGFIVAPSNPLQNAFQELSHRNKTKFISSAWALWRKSFDDFPSTPTNSQLDSTRLLAHSCWKVESAQTAEAGENVCKQESTAGHIWLCNALLCTANANWILKYKEYSSIYILCLELNEIVWVK